MCGKVVPTPSPDTVVHDDRSPVSKPSKNTDPTAEVVTESGPLALKFPAASYARMVYV